MKNFLIYTYIHNYHLAIAAILAGIIFGLIYTRKRNRKTASILLCVLLTGFIGYPVFSMNGYLIESSWQDQQNTTFAKQNADKLWMKQQCNLHKDYIMRHTTCYKPFNGYIPLTTWTINETVGNAVAQTDGK